MCVLIRMMGRTEERDCNQGLKIDSLPIDSLQNNEALIFVHLMKTGGTTLSQLIREHYPKERIFHFVPKKDGQTLHDLEQMDRSQRERLQFVHGHAKFGFHQHLSQPARYITMLREPVSRIISLYYFIHQNPTREMPPEKHCPTLASYLDTRLKALDNRQTRAIAGPTAARVPFGEVTPEILEMAKKNLETFLMVGVTERFDESVIVLKHALDLKNILYTRVNANSNKPKIDQIDPADIERIKAYNAYDLELYAYVNQLLDQKISQIGPSFQSEYEKFREKNKQFNAVVPPEAQSVNPQLSLMGKVKQKLHQAWLKINY